MRVRYTLNFSGVEKIERETKAAVPVPRTTKIFLRPFFPDYRRIEIIRKYLVDADARVPVTQDKSRAPI